MAGWACCHAQTTPETTIDESEHEHALAHLRAIAGELPEVNERLSHGQPTFFLRDKRVVATLWGGPEDGPAVVAPAPDGVQAEVVTTEPDRFFRPPYVGHRGWIGLRLDDADWDEVRAVVHDAYRLVAPVGLAQGLAAPVAPTSA